MADAKDAFFTKIKETRFAIFAPLLITIVCAWFDIWFTKTEYNFLDISKTIYTYIFPSIASIMITLIAQQLVYNSDFGGIIEGREGLSAALLVVYSVAYLSCLGRYNIYTALVFLILSLTYIFVTWFFCLDHNLTHIKDLKKKEKKALEKNYRQTKIRR